MVLVRLQQETYQSLNHKTEVFISNLQAEKDALLPPAPPKAARAAAPATALAPSAPTPSGPVEDMSLPDACRARPQATPLDLLNLVPVAAPGRRGSVVDLQAFGDQALNGGAGTGGGVLLSSEQTDELLQVWSFLLQFK